MKYCLFCILLISSLIFSSCKNKKIGTEDVSITQPAELQDDQQIQLPGEDSTSIPLDEIIVSDSDKTEASEQNQQVSDIKENNSSILQNQKNEISNKKDSDNEEYLRSTNDLSIDDSVTLKEFEEDKAAILKVIEELSVIMETKNANEWLKYLEPNSINYYSTPANLIKVQKKLPNKTIHLRNIGDYFNYVFIPSRQRSKVDEIRYISKTNIKAVQVKDDKSIVVYYYFTKVDGKWLVHLPPLS